MAGYWGNRVDNVYDGRTYTWYCYLEYTTSETATTFTVNMKVKMVLAGDPSAGTGIGITGGNCSAALSISGNVVKRANPTSDYTLMASLANGWTLISHSYTYNKGTKKVTRAVGASVSMASWSVWAGTSSYTNSALIVIPALPTYAVKYSANGGSGAPSLQTKTHNVALTLSSVKPIRTGYTFTKWKASDGTLYNAGASYTANAATTMTAQWSINSYTLTYNANGGSVSPSSRSVTYGSNYYSTLPTPTRANYNFLGWYTAASGGTKITSSNAIMGASNTTIYAHWEVAYIAPKANIIEARRDSTNHDGDDSGTIGFVKFTWQTGDDAGTVVTPSSYDLIFTEQGTRSSFTISNIPITSSPVQVYTDDLDSSIILDTEKSYTVSVVLHTTGRDDVSDTNYISPAYFVIDINEDGTAIGFGTSVGDTDDGFVCAMNAHFREDIDLSSGKKYKINGEDLSASHIGAVPTTRTVNGKALSLDIADADYVIEQGTSSSWTYRKWKSGKVEAWRSYSFSSASWSVWASPIRYMDKSISFPSGLFSRAPLTVATSDSNQYWVVNCYATSATAGTLRLATVASSAMETYVGIYAWTN